jgi:hypothetical protein
MSRRVKERMMLWPPVLLPALPGGAAFDQYGVLVGSNHPTG